MKFLSVDPGESVGYAVWPDSKPGTAPDIAGTALMDEFAPALALANGIPAPGLAEAPINTELLDELCGLEHVVIEDWALYPPNVSSGPPPAWDKCRTARLIGAIELVCVLSGTPYTLQPAAIKDAAESAGAADLFLRPLHPNRHANDAIRHGVFFQLKEAQAGR